jgi:CDP-glycerol glycerophosphotransferase (TagB/SpsB family)
LKMLAPHDLDWFVEQWDSLPNCCTETMRYGELFDASDIILTDGVSFLYEYHLFRKPLIFFDSGVHAPFNKLGKLVEKAAHRVFSFEEMKAAALEYKAGKAWELVTEREELLKVIQPFEKKASQIILDTIADDIRNGE